MKACFDSSEMEGGSLLHRGLVPGYIKNALHNPELGITFHCYWEPITAKCYQPRAVGQIPIFGHFNFKSREEQERSKARQNMVSIKTLFGLDFSQADGLLAVRRVLAGEICFSEKMTSDGADSNSDLSVKANRDLQHE